MMMRRIYMGAIRVISFVGSEVRDLDIGLDFVNLLNLNISKEKLLPLVRHYKYEKQWKAIGNLWDQEYWKRVWIIQEVVVASEILVCYGRRTIAWEKFSKLIQQLVDLSDTGELRGYISMFCFSGPAMLDRLRRQRQDKGQGWPLAALLGLCLDAQSTDPRDKIYGLLGMQDPETDDGDILYLRYRQQKRRQLSSNSSYEAERAYARVTGRMEEWERFFQGVTGAPSNFPRNNGIEPDYSKSVLELWQEVMSWPNLWDNFLLLNFSQLVQEVLGMAPKKHVQRFLQAAATTNDGPSTSEFRSSHGEREKEQPSQKFLGKQKAGMSDTPGLGRTRSLYYTAGICRSTVLFLGPPYTSLNASLKLLRQWIKLYFHPTKKLENKGELPSVMMSGVTQAENDLHRVIPIHSSQSYAKVGEWTYVGHVDEVLDNTKKDDLPSGHSSLQVSDEELCLNPGQIPPSLKSSPGLLTATSTPTASEQARWFISDRGQIGLAPHSAEEGDLICQFKNCDVVALVRKLGGSGENSGLVGRAVLMPRWDERSENSAPNRFRYSIPSSRLWENLNLNELPALTDQERVSLFVDIKALWLLTQ
jgi:hypothetical protein